MVRVRASWTIKVRGTMATIHCLWVASVEGVVHRWWHHVLRVGMAVESRMVHERMWHWVTHVLMWIATWNRPWVSMFSLHLIFIVLVMVLFRVA